MQCEVCGTETRGGVCPQCTGDRTRTFAGRSSSRGAALSDSSVDEGRFIPGSILADRYRVISLLGAGGMGEVYRATDLKLGQAVALKFLPASASEEALGRFRAEVRVARQISHPNVCRVYDIAEVDGQQFLSMEYIDGEDLSSLLRRIGRLPQDKAIDIARQICAGLAAAHDRGVLHRDLKPSNVLLDGRGVAHIADFGLAAAEEIRAGTPLYMAPEQFEGKEVTVRSDIYSLGLVLYELFTGKRALRADSQADLRAQHKSTPESMSSVVHDIDPAVERVILQCLSLDPAMRSQSALAVSAALPGGDPLAAALAAGETPSPALVAAAGHTYGIKPAHAALLAGFVLAGLVGMWFVFSAVNGLGSGGPQAAPEIMAERTREMLRRLGYAGRPFDEAYGYSYNGQYLQYRRTHTAVRWPTMTFWYRQSPETLVNFNPADTSVAIGDIRPGAPPPLTTGMISTVTDTEGRLVSLTVVTPEIEPKEVGGVIDWNAALKAAGHDPALYRQVRPEWLPDWASDARTAWVGRDPARSPDVDIRIEAAAYKGKLVSFRTILPWTEPFRTTAANRPRGAQFNQVFQLTLISVLALTGVYMARMNLRAGRGDKKGALRLAAVVAATHMVTFALGAHHPLDSDQIPLIGLAISIALLKAALLWTGYIALEPIARRRWPNAMISWTRLLDGRWKDPLVGRDVLIGVSAAICAAFLIYGHQAADRAWGGSSFVLPSQPNLQGMQTMIANHVNETGYALLSSLATFLVLVLARLLVKRDWIAVVLCGALFALPSAFGAGTFWTGFSIGFLVNALVFLVAARAGLTALVSVLVVLNVAMDAPATLDWSLYYSKNALLVYAVVAAAALCAFRVALAGRPLWPQDSVS
jgi:serine/threonine-protein kinase